MNLLNHSQTNNIQDIIDNIEEQTNLTVPSAVIIPLKQHRTVNLSANDTFEIDVELVTFLVITSSRQLQQTLLKMYFLEVLVQSNMRVQTSFLKSIFHASKVRQRVSSFCLPCF